MKIILLIAALALPAAAQAQVYKCQDGGHTVYSQDPCPGRAQIIDATPATGGYDPGAAAQRRAQNARIGAQNAVEDARRDRLRAQTDAQRDAERAEKQRRCEQIRRSKQSSEYWSKEFRHPDNIRREQDRAKQAGSELWWECGKLD